MRSALSRQRLAVSGWLSPEHVDVHAYVPEKRSQRNKKKSSVLLDSGVRRNDDSSTKNEPNDPNDLNDLNDPNDLNMVSCKE